MEEWKCSGCDAEQQEERNCHNRRGLAFQMLQGESWNTAVPNSYHDLEVLKVDDAKFFACPVSFITAKSWEILELVNETTDAESGKIQHLPFPGTITQQPEWYRDAVKIKRNERLSEWYAEKLEQRMKDRSR